MASILLSLSCIALCLSAYLEQQLDSVMTLGWEIDETNKEIDITLKCKVTKGYCSIGFRETMKNCDMIAVLTDSVDYTFEDYWSYNHDTPLSDIAEGGSRDVEYVSGGIDVDGYLNIVLKRKLQTSDEFDQDIDADVKGKICWAYLENREGWREHSHDNSASFTWATIETNKYFSKSGAELVSAVAAFLIIYSF